MAKAVISYDKDLPEVPGRRPWERPNSYLVKDETAHTGWRVDDSGRRPSQLLLVPKLRAAVDAWREGGYPGASEVTQRLFSYWFEEDHEVEGFNVPFRYYFCQREAIETLVYLVEIAGQRDSKALIEAFGEVYQRDLVNQNIAFETTMDGRRRLRRYVPEREVEGVQDLPPENLRRYAFKMANGSGKTWVMAMAMVWSHYHKKRVPDSDLSTNFLIVAPNVIVYQSEPSGRSSVANFLRAPGKFLGTYVTAPPASSRIRFRASGTTAAWTWRGSRTSRSSSS